MNGIKLLLVAAEVSALICLILLQIIPTTTADSSTKSAVTCMFAIVAVMIQSMQQDIKWKLD